MVVWVHHRLVAQLAPQDLNRPVGYDFIGVHVALSAAASLPDHQGKMVQQPPILDLPCCLHYGCADLLVQDAKAHVDLHAHKPHLGVNGNTVTFVIFLQLS